MRPKPFLRYEALHVDSGKHHMAKETELFLEMERALRAGETGDATVPLLRLYQWDVPTVSLGKSQTPEVALAPVWEAWNAGDTRRAPQALVTRPTGGRAVWHEQELTYSVLFPIAHPIFGGGANSPEEVFGNWLLEGAQAAGIQDLSLERGGKGRDPLGIGPAPCFASTSRMELKWHGAKWVGSARRLGQAAMLQHGAIRMGPAGDKLEEWLTGNVIADGRPWQELPSADRLAQCLADALTERLQAL